MFKLTVTRDHQIFAFEGGLADLIQQAGDFDTASITDPDGLEVYSLSFPSCLQYQAV